VKSATLVVACVVVLFATRNLPWHLDDLDQAKQAYTSYEMIGQGNWWFQHTPTGRVATKPPLAGWVSATLYIMTGGRAWDLAWRLPPFLCALVLLRMLWRSGHALGGAMGAMLAVAAFGLNATTPRLATLVRTDMMLTLFIFLAGWLVFEKLRRGEAWTTRDRWQLFAAMLASMLTKGPIAYAFLLPGLVAYAVIARRRTWPNLAWSGWWPWFAPLGVFGLWAGIGIRLSPEFYEQVVLKEFLGRFTVGEAAVHNNQSVFYYLLQGAKYWLPWSLLLPVVAFRDCRAAGAVRDAGWWRRAGSLLACARARVAELFSTARPASLWLVCWAVGGLLFMSLVPSKRFDRIFPVLPPLCLMLVALYDRAARAKPQHFERLATAAVTLAIFCSGGYAGYKVIDGYRTQQGALVSFGKQVREMTAVHPDRLAVVNAKDEGMAMYTGATRFTSADDAVDLWRAGRIDWLLLGEGTLAKRAAELRPYRRALEMAKIPKKASAYVLLSRAP
jgi:4-amino-4-deoxy-L-arabinose transferase-like glycosyltransferase